MTSTHGLNHEFLFLVKYYSGAYRCYTKNTFTIPMLSVLSVLLLLILITVVAFWLFVMISGLWGYFVTKVPFVPTKSADIDLLIRTLPITKNDIVYDLGSGDGRVVIYIAAKTRAVCKGFELTLWTYLLSRLRARYMKLPVTFIRENFFETNWSEPTIIYCYLYPTLMDRVHKKAVAECRPGTKVVSRDFAIGGWEPKQVIEAGSHKLYVYQVD